MSNGASSYFLVCFVFLLLAGVCLLGDGVNEYTRKHDTQQPTHNNPHPELRKELGRAAGREDEQRVGGKARAPQPVEREQPRVRRVLVLHLLRRGLGFKERLVG